MNKIVVEVIERPSKYVLNQTDRTVRQTFTCCGKQLEKLFHKGWDYVCGDIIAGSIFREFKYCPYCGKELEVTNETIHN